METCPAVLTEEQTKEMQGYAVKAYHTLKLESYARMDFLMNKEGKMYCLEANTLPGMTPTSLLPQEAAVLGMSYADPVSYTHLTSAHAVGTAKAMELGEVEGAMSSLALSLIHIFGLSLCKSIINAHGGEISVSDNKPHGAIFTFTLPAKEARLHE